MNNLPVISDNYLITCIVQVGKGHNVLEKLKNEKNIVRSGVYHARGVGLSGEHRNRFAEKLEKDVVVVLVTNAMGDDIFNYLYQIAELYKPHQGFMYMEKIELATDMLLPADSNNF